MDFGKYIAHRGLHDIKKGIPENSMKAFEEAIKKGVAIELDVRLSKDGRVVVFHDKTLKRMCGVDTPVFDFTYEQLSAFRLKDTDEKIPLLSQVLKLVNGRVPVVVELKESVGVFDLEKRTYYLLKGYKGKYAVMSFNPISLWFFRVFAPDITRGQLISRFKNKKVRKYIERIICASPLVWKLISKPEFIACDLRCVSIETAFQAVDIGADFLTWTANSKELIESAKQFSKSVIFEGLEDDFDLTDNFNEN